MIDELMFNVVDELVTEQNQTSQDWYLLDFSLPVEAGRAQYNIEDLAPNFGKAHFIFTEDPGNTTFKSRPVEIVDYLQLVRDFSGGDPGPAGVKHSARAFAFPYNDEQKRLEAVIGPTPGESASYRVMFEPATVRPQSVTEQAFRHQQFSGYVADRIAFKALHLCRWEIFDEITDPSLREKANKDKRAEIRQTLAMEIGRGDDLFKRFKKSTSQPNSFRRLHFGRGRRH